MPHATSHFDLPQTTDPKAARIAMLSAEFITAGPARRDEIGNEIAGLISGDVAVLPRAQNS